MKKFYLNSRGRSICYENQKQYDWNINGDRNFLCVKNNKMSYEYIPFDKINFLFVKVIRE